MATEYGVFNDEGCIEDQLWSAGEAETAAGRYRAEGDTLAKAGEICPDHEGQPREGCEACAAESDDDDEQAGEDGEDEDDCDSWSDAA